MTEETKPKPPKLKGEAALNLWRQGRDAWNRWIDENPGTDISFAGVDFSNEWTLSEQISFASFRFGDGKVDFSETKFDNRSVSFSNSIFGKGDVTFTHTTFGDGRLDFSRADFSECSVSFLGANFGNDNTDFICTEFGNVDFGWACFGNGNVSFNKAEINDINFSGTTFRDGDLSFDETVFEEGEVRFDEAKLAKLSFRPSKLGSNRIVAHGLSIEHRAVFELPPLIDNLKSFELLGASFNGPLILSGSFGIIPDLRATRLSHQVELSFLNCKLRRNWQKPGLTPKQFLILSIKKRRTNSQALSNSSSIKSVKPAKFRKLRSTWRRKFWPLKLSTVAIDQKDAARLRRLKEIAETNKDHQAALRFSADENRARRWIETSWFGSVLDMAFSGFSNYGQSILRPSLWLFGFFLGFMGIYKTLATAKCLGWLAALGQAALLSISNSLPFLPQSRDLRKTAQDALYSTDPSFWVHTLMITQGTLSFVFLFLIGLGLRNRFRL